MKFRGSGNGDGEGGVGSGYRSWSLGEAGAGKGHLAAPAMRVISHRACASLAESGVDIRRPNNDTIRGRCQSQCLLEYTTVNVQSNQSNVAPAA
jgi:hypothetical protein